MLSIGNVAHMSVVVPWFLGIEMKGKYFWNRFDVYYCPKTNLKLFQKRFYL